MRVKNFNLVIVLIAEILVAIYGYVYHYPLPSLVKTMAVVFLIFFVIGSILQGMSNRLFAQVEAREAKEREEELMAEQLKEQNSEAVGKEQPER
ncbi:MAG: hypothetical protein Q4A29_03155 [Eubacteriales bacterium]|nr:hypothetical protein [Eubacteriales bacterium]